MCTKDTGQWVRGGGWILTCILRRQGSSSSSSDAARCEGSSRERTGLLLLHAESGCRCACAACSAARAGARGLWGIGARVERACVPRLAGARAGACVAGASARTRAHACKSARFAWHSKRSRHNVQRRPLSGTPVLPGAQSPGPRMLVPRQRSARGRAGGVRAAGRDARRRATPGARRKACGMPPDVTNPAHARGATIPSNSAANAALGHARTCRVPCSSPCCSRARATRSVRTTAAGRPLRARARRARRTMYRECSAPRRRHLRAAVRFGASSHRVGTRPPTWTTRAGARAPASQSHGGDSTRVVGTVAR